MLVAGLDRTRPSDHPTGMRFTVQIPISGYVLFEIEAESVQRAVNEALAELKANRQKNAKEFRVRVAPGAIVTDEG